MVLRGTRCRAGWGVGYVADDEVAVLAFGGGVGDGDRVVGEDGAGDLEEFAGDGGVLGGGMGTWMMVTEPL